MSLYDDSKHPRNHPTGASRFSNKIPGAPEGSVELAPSFVGDQRTGAEVLEGAIRGRWVTKRSPVGVTATRVCLRNSRGEADDAVRQVTLDWVSVPAASRAGDFDVVGPKDGRPLIIVLRDGLPRIRIVSGSVIVRANSGAGNSITIGDGATATIIAGHGCKVSTYAEAGSVVDFYAEPGARGYQDIANGALFTFHGSEEDGGIRLSTTPDPMFAEFFAEVRDRDVV